MLVIDNVEVVYDDVLLALRGVSLEVPQGAIVALLGPNGAGKTTALRACTGLLPLHRGAVRSGTISLDGKRIDRIGAPEIVRAGIAQVMEGRRVFAELTVEENLRVGSYSNRSGLGERLRRMFELFPVLGERRTQSAGYLSGGEQQMLAIARALVARPRLLLLDEPSLGLAPLLVQEIFREIARINREDGVTILLVEQNAHLALGLASRGYVIETGRIVLEDLAPALLANPQVREAYLG